jgi:hypothetical protein
MVVLPEEIQSLVQHIADQLGETEAKPVGQIKAMIEHCGVDFVHKLLQDTLETEANGGLMLPDQSRRRSMGGVFFYLGRGRISKEIRSLIFPPFQNPNALKKSLPPLPPHFKWDERVEIVQKLFEDKGEMTTVKVTLIGRPGKVEMRRDLVITTMSHSAKTPTLPKGVPSPPAVPTLYTVYIAAKQWRKVEEAVADPNDALIIEGTCAFDTAVNAMAVYAMSVTTKNIEAKKRQQQKEAKGDLKSEISAAVPPPQPEKPVVPPVVSVSIPPSAPPEVAQKLNELHASASLFRQKIAAIKAKPVDQQSGLEMTQKLLKNVEDQITALEKKHS